MSESHAKLAREGVAPRGYLVPIYWCLESREPDRFRLPMGATLEKRSGSILCTCIYIQPRVCAWPHPFSARGEFPGNAEDTAGHSSS